MRDWRQYTSETLNDLNLRAKKSMGQNFLIRYRVVNQIVDKSKVLPTDHILEIGGGVGILTEALVKTGARVTVIEKESKLAGHLQGIYEGNDRVKIIEDDALLADWPDDIRVISNLPYSISTPIVDKILHHDISDATLMLQREVGLRCLAKAGKDNYSRLSVLCNIHAKTRRLMDVASESFYPRPKVSSVVLQMTKVDRGLTNDHEDIEELATNLFSLKRRIVRKVIRGFLKRQDVDDHVWDDCPYNQQRIFNVSVEMLDEILTHLKGYNAWPLAQPVD